MTDTDEREGLESACPHTEQEDAGMELSENGSAAVVRCVRCGAEERR